MPLSSAFFYKKKPCFEKNSTSFLLFTFPKVIDYVVRNHFSLVTNKKERY